MTKKLIYCLGLLLSPTLLSSQVANNTSLVGTVLDSSGSVVSGAKVTAVEEATKVTYSAVTNSAGYYAITFIQPGTYDLTTEEKGFSKTTTVGVPVPVDIAVRTDVSLKVGSTADTVTITASTPPLATDDASLGETFETKQVEDLPIQGHNALEVAALASNVIVGSKTSYSGNPPGVDFIGAGQRETQNELTLDGISIMNNLGNVTPARPSTDMVSEVQMQSGNYSAQYGAYLGVHINLISKYGTNDLHGVLYDYIKNTDLDARNFTDKKATSTTPATLKAPLNYNQWGFTLGGPIFVPKLYNGRNRTFFFGSYEKLNQKAQSTGTASVLTQAMRNGDFSALGSWNGTACVLPAGQVAGSYTPTCIKDPQNPTVNGGYYPGNVIPANELATAAAAIAKKYEAYVPLPNTTTSTANGTQNNLASVNFPSRLFVAQTLERVDENIGEKVKLFLRFHWQDLTYANGNQVPVSGGYGPANSRNYAIGYTHIITPNIVNDLHLGLNQFYTAAVNYWYQNGLKTAGTDLGIPGFNYDTTQNMPGIPNVQVTSNTGMNIGNNGTNWFQDDRTLDGYDQISYTHGKHNIIAGVEIRKLETGRIAANEVLGLFNFTGSVTGYGGADFVLGLPNNVQTPVASPKGSVAEYRDGFFVLDNWQATSKLTLNYGLRYDLPTVPYSLNGYVRTMNAAQTVLLPVSSATTAASFTPVPGYKLASPTHDNWGPRLGFAYRALPHTVVRGGAGFYYNANQLNSFTLLTSNNYPFGAYFSYAAAQGTAANPLSFTNPTPGQASASPVTGTCSPSCTYGSAVTYDPANKTQRSYQWNLSVGEELWKGAAAEAQYVGSRSLDLDTSDYDNLPNFGGTGVVFTQPTKVNLGSAQGSCGQATCLVRPNQLFGSIRDLRNIAWSNYQGLTLVLRQRSFHGISGQASYTWSHDLDVSSDSNGGGTPSQPFNLAADYGNSNWDIRNRFVGAVTYELPKFSGSNLLVREAAGGWQVNAVVNLQSGMPYNVTLGYNSAGLDQGSERPSWVHAPKSNCSIQTYISGNTTPCFDLTAYQLPVAQQTPNGTGGTNYNYAFGNTARNVLHGPGFNYVNMSLFKNFSITDRAKFQFRAEAANVFNHPSAANPNATLNAAALNSTAVSAGSAGTVTSVQAIPGELTGSRVLQLAGKIIF
ncbi:TonB-dependent receptor [Granulicella paludicola]|uniref:TonB-dependent receptor n=1 Tax=Granulicella paludicola TaxID=474951 RepID=UPI0021E053AF|nr:carboxypeptidase regulatory-like domain-containing protein [Granulicella paludicola]